MLLYNGDLAMKIIENEDLSFYKHPMVKQKHKQSHKDYSGKNSDLYR